MFHAQHLIQENIRSSRLSRTTLLFLTRILYNYRNSKSIFKTFFMHLHNFQTFLKYKSQISPNIARFFLCILYDLCIIYALF